MYRNDKHRWIKLGYMVYFEIDSTGLHNPGDEIHIDISYYALDNKNFLHAVDIYVPDVDYNYHKLESSEFADVSKAFTLSSSNRGVSERDPGNPNKNTWKFEMFLPSTAKAVKKREALDLVNDNIFNHML